MSGFLSFVLCALPGLIEISSGSSNRKGLFLPTLWVTCCRKGVWISPWPKMTVFPVIYGCVLIFFLTQNGVLKVQNVLVFFSKNAPLPFSKHVAPFCLSLLLNVETSISVKTLAKSSIACFTAESEGAWGLFLTWPHKLLCMHVCKALMSCKSICDVKSGIDPYLFWHGHETNGGSYIIKKKNVWATARMHFTQKINVLGWDVRWSTLRKRAKFTPKLWLGNDSLFR